MVDVHSPIRINTFVLESVYLERPYKENKLEFELLRITPQGDNQLPSCYFTIKNKTRVLIGIIGPAKRC